MSISNHFESALRRDALRKQALLLRAPRNGVIPGWDRLQALEEQWLPIDLMRCRSSHAQCDGCRGGRCTASYWRAHGRRVSKLLAGFGELVGLDRDLCAATGFVHDLDYLKCPHDVAGTDPCAAHPFPILRVLTDWKVPPDMALAVLEHSPHLRIPLTRSLSCCLVACGDLATLAAAGVPLDWPSDIPAGWVGYLQGLDRAHLADPSIRVERFVERVLPALRNLQRFL